MASLKANIQEEKIMVTLIFRGKAYTSVFIGDGDGGMITNACIADLLEKDCPDIRNNEPLYEAIDNLECENVFEVAELLEVINTYE